MFNNLGSIWLVGSGLMAVDYAKVLSSLNPNFSVIGRSEQGASNFYQKTGIAATPGGVAAFAKNNELPNYAIVSVNVEELSSVALFLIKNGVKNILLEKPGGTNIDEISKIAIFAKKIGANVQVAYNRRFYSSTLEANRIIDADGGVTSFNFEFTEWSHQIEKLNFPKAKSEIWFLANSTHVVDLAFYLGGNPKKMSCYTAGSLDWYKTASIFSGSGISEKGALFSYQANWKSPGRWSVEMLTLKHRLIFKPMEQLHIQNIGSVSVEQVQLDDSLDKKYKPGLYLQTKAFLENNTMPNIINIHQHLQNMAFYEQIEHGN